MSSPDPPRIPPTLPGEPPAPRLPEPFDDDPPPRRRTGWFWVFAVLAPLLLAPAAAVLALRWLPPATTAFMLQSPVQPVRYAWVPASRLPESLRRAAVAAEDQKFWTHQGFDLDAIADALEHNAKGRRKRGASTITQQTAKNLFLWPSRSWLRKGLEASFTVLLELMLPKGRILEIYLNIAEFGPGVYGAEAAAQTFFGKPAQRLAPWEAAQLVAVLPNPRKWRADRPGPYVQSRVDWILAQLGEPPRFAAAPAFEPAPFEELPEEPALEEPLLEEHLLEERARGEAVQPEDGGPVQTTPLEPPPDDATAPSAAAPEPAQTP